MIDLFPEEPKELFKDNPGLQEYAERITAEWTKWATMADELAVTGKLIDQGFAAFMANAINSAVARSSHEDVKRYFSLNVSS
ncbi:MAG: hypothetical protein GWN58_13625 [Anaerolineae bacterium]|nr:hypothetical protein [Anaerolineae bacterium]